MGARYGKRADGRIQNWLYSDALRRQGSEWYHVCDVLVLFRCFVIDYVCVLVMTCLCVAIDFTSREWRYYYTMPRW